MQAEDSNIRIITPFLGGVTVWHLQTNPNVQLLKANRFSMGA